MTADGTVRVERRGACAWVTLDRPPLNLLEPGVIRALRDTFAGLARDPAVRAAVVTGAGRATTGGMQIQFLMDLDPASAKLFITPAPRGHPVRARGALSHHLHGERALPRRGLRAGHGL